MMWRLGAGSALSTPSRWAQRNGGQCPMAACTGMHAPLPPSMVPVGWEYPAHLLQQGTIRAGEPAQGAYSAADSVTAPQPGHAQQVCSPQGFRTTSRPSAASFTPV